MAGISGYGNSVGVPTVGGELTFAPGYARNPLVNVLCLGVMPTERLVLGAATGEGNLAVLLGSTTGRDGIGGVSVLASAAFGGEGDGGRRQAPQRAGGRPLRGEAAHRGVPRAARPRPRGRASRTSAAPGLTCATSETAARGGMGMDVDVDAVPRREPAMEPFEVMTSESQERMLAIVTPADRDAVEEVCRRWEVRATVIGTVTDRRPGACASSTPTARCWPTSRPPRSPTTPRSTTARGRLPPTSTSAGATTPAARWRRASRPRASPPTCSRCWRPVVGLPPVRPPALPQHRGRARGRTPPCCAWPRPGLPPSDRGLAISTDSNPRWCALDPRRARP